MGTAELFGSTARPVAYDSILLKPGYARLQGGAIENVKAPENILMIAIVPLYSSNWFARRA